MGCWIHRGSFAMLLTIAGECTSLCAQTLSSRLFFSAPKTAREGGCWGREQRASTRCCCLPRAAAASSISLSLPEAIPHRGRSGDLRLRTSGLAAAASAGRSRRVPSRGSRDSGGCSRRSRAAGMRGC